MTAEGPRLDRLVTQAEERKLTLVTQGGGIGGGAYVVGVMKALKQLGVLPYIGRTIASSAGVPATVYPLMGKDRLAEHVWIEEVTKPEVVDLRRALTNRPILDIDFLVDEILAKHPLDREAFNNHPIEMQLSATRIDRERQSLEQHMFTNRDTYEPLQMMKAAIAIPIVYGRTVIIEGAGEFIDGGILRQISFEGDIQIITEPRNKGEGTGGYGERLLFKRYASHDPIEAKIHEAARARHGLYMREYMQILEELPRYPNKVLIQPEEHVPAALIERNPKRVEATIKRGYEDTMKRERVLHELLGARLAA